MTWREVVYEYDGSFDGLLCCIYESYTQKELPAAFFRTGELEPCLYEVRAVTTDAAHTRRVYEGFRRFSPEVGPFLRRAYWTCLPEKELAIYRFAAKLYREGKPLLQRLTDSNLNHTGIYLYSKGKIMIHLTFDYKTDEKCTTPGQYLKYHRTFQGLSTRELAEKVGIVPATLVLYENDRHPIKYKTAVALANALGIDRNRLLDEYTAFVDYPYSSLLKKVRQDLSLTQIQMAELIGIGQTSYSSWEREIRVPRRKEYDKILAALEKLRVNVDTYLCQSASI